MQKQSIEPSVVITPEDVDVLIQRLEALSSAITRNIARAIDREVFEDVVDNILFDMRYAVVEAWAEKHFPGRFSGITAAEAGKFDFKWFEFFKENELIEDVLFEDKIDRVVSARQRKSLEAKNLAELEKGEPVFWAVRNPVADMLQFRPGRYATETETKKWFRSLNKPNVRAYGVFADLVPGVIVKERCVRFVSLHEENPCTENSVFLGWGFVKGNEDPKQTSFYEFGQRFGALFGFEDATFDEVELESSTFESSIERKWSETTD